MGSFLSSRARMPRLTTPYVVHWNQKLLEVVVPSEGVVSAAHARETLLFWGAVLPDFMLMSDWSAATSVAAHDTTLMASDGGKRVLLTVSYLSTAKVLISALEARGYVFRRTGETVYEGWLDADEAGHGAGEQWAT